MRREQFSTTITDVGWVDDDGSPAQPVLRIAYDGDADRLHPRLRAPDDEVLAGDEIDATVRLHGGVGDEDTTGVIAITNRYTGEYILEAETAAADLLAFTQAARRYGERTDEPATYQVTIEAGEEPVATYEKQALLVYGDDGELLRNHSLIPSGVEL